MAIFLKNTIKLFSLDLSAGSLLLLVTEGPTNSYGLQLPLLMFFSFF